MTDIEKKALEQAVAAAGRRMQDYAIMAEGNLLRKSIEAHARAIEQHEAYKREVSDAVEELAVCVYDDSSSIVRRYMGRFIIAKPDPLEDVLDTLGWSFDDTGPDMADDLRAAIEARGGRIVWEGE